MYYFCRDKSMLAATKLLSRQNYVLSQQAYICHDKRRVLSRQTRDCRDKNFC